MKIDIVKRLRKDRIITAMEFSLHGIKLAQYSIAKNVAKDIFTQDVISGSAQEFISALEKTIRNNHLKIDNLFLSLDRSLVVTQLVKLPSIKKEEVEQMSKWQAARILPCKPEEIVFSHKAIRTDRQGFSYVVLVVATKSIVNKFINICRALKLMPQAITFSSEGLCKWYANQTLDKGGKETVAVVDIDKDKTELVIICENNSVFNRSLLLNSSYDENNIMLKIAKELRLSFEFYRSQEIASNIDKIIITGDKNYAHRLPAVLRQEFNLPIEIINHLANANTIKSDLEEKIAQGISVASLFGFMAGRSSIEIDLIPQEIKDRRMYLDKKKASFKTFVLILFSSLVLCGIVGYDFYYKSKIGEYLSKKIAETDAIVREIQGIKNKIAIINKKIDSRNACLNVLREIHRLIPGDIYLNTYIFKNAGEVVLKGNAREMSSVFSFVHILNESMLLDNVKVKYAAQKKTQSDDFTDFEIACKLE